MTILDNYMFRPLLTVFRLSSREHWLITDTLMKSFELCPVFVSHSLHLLKIQQLLAVVVRELK